MARKHKTKCEVNTNGLATVINVAIPTDNLKYYADPNSEANKVPWPETYPLSPYVVYDESYHFTIIKPNPGVNISKITYWTKKTDAYGNITEEYKDSQRSIGTVITKNLLNDKKYDFLWSYGGTYLLGCILIDIFGEYTYAYDGSTNEEDSDEETKYVTVTGENDYLELYEATETSKQQSLHYVYEGHTYVIRHHNGTSHTYSNVIGVCGEYSTSEDEPYVDQYTLGQDNPSTTLSDIWQLNMGTCSENSPAYPEKANSLQYNSYTTDTGIFIEFCQGVSDPPIRTVLLYIDCFLGVVSSSLSAGNAGTWSKPLGIRDTIASLSDLEDKIWEEKCEYEDRSVVIQFISKNLYNSESDYFTSRPKTLDTTSLEPDSRLRNMVEHEYDSIFPSMRWIRALHINSIFGNRHARISGFYNTVICWDEKHSIHWLVTCTSSYNRFTGYWLLHDNNGIIGVLRGSENFPTKFKRNCILTPIFKPWAAVELVAFSPTPVGGGNGNFGVSVPDNNSTYKLIHQKLIDQYTSKYVTSYVYDTTDEMNFTGSNDEKREKLIKSLMKYYKTQSPFRIEHFLCHGARHEKDENTPGSGRCGLMVNHAFGLGNESFDILHSKCYSETSLSLKWNIFSQSCFGQGVCFEYSTSPNSHVISSGSDVIYVSDVAAWFSACGTSIGFGSLQDQIGQDYIGVGLEKIINESTTYSEIAQTYNSAVDECRTYTFRKIYDFYIDNFDLMKSKISDSSASVAWDATKDTIVQDLLSNPPGQKYFCRACWEPENTFAYNASDNFLNYEQYGKQYRIHDGFIGYIKQAINQSLAKSNDANIWPIPVDGDDLDRNLKALVQEIENLHVTKLGNKLCTASSFLNPKMVVSGAFANAGVQFMRNPNESENEIFGSDNDLKALRDETVNKYKS